CQFLSFLFFPLQTLFRFILLVVIALAVTLIIGLIKFNDFFTRLKNNKKQRDYDELHEEIIGLEEDETDNILEKRKKELNNKLSRSKEHTSELQSRFDIVC